MHLPKEKWPKGNSKLEAPVQSMRGLQTHKMTGSLQDSKSELISLDKYPSLTRLFSDCFQSSVYLQLQMHCDGASNWSIVS